MVGISNVTAINLSSITEITNSSSIAEFTVKVNWIIFEGWMFFSLLLVLWFILIITAHRNQKARGVEPRLLANIMISGFPITLGSFLLRAVEVSIYGLKKALFTDYQLWIIPIITIVIATTLWITKDDG